MAGAVLIALMVLLYLIPTIVAICRNISGMGGVFVINLLLGWTFVFWVIALAWACGQKPEPKQV